MVSTALSKRVSNSSLFFKESWSPLVETYRLGERPGYTSTGAGELPCLRPRWSRWMDVVKGVMAMLFEVFISHWSYVGRRGLTSSQKLDE